MVPVFFPAWVLKVNNGISLHHREMYKKRAESVPPK